MKKNLFISLDLIKYRKYICIQSSLSQSQSKSSLSSMGTSSVCSLSLSLVLVKVQSVKYGYIRLDLQVDGIVVFKSFGRHVIIFLTEHLVRLRFSLCKYCCLQISRKACHHLPNRTSGWTQVPGAGFRIGLAGVGLGVEVQDRLDSRVEVWIWFGVGLGVKVQDRLDSRVEVWIWFGVGLGVKVQDRQDLRVREGQISRFQIDITFRLLSGREPKNRIESQ